MDQHASGEKRDVQRMSNGVDFEARGDSAHLWTHFKAFTLVGFVTGIVVFCALVAENPDGSILWAAFCSLVIPLLAALFSGAVTIYWRNQVLPVRYVVADGKLMSIRGDRVLDEYPISDIESVEVDGYMDVRHFFFTTLYVPQWPHLRIRLDANRTHEFPLVSFPPIMIWGRVQARQVETQLRIIV